MPPAYARWSTQQFDVARQIVAAGLVPIIEPEVDIKCPDKAGAEDLLKAEVMAGSTRCRPASS